MKKFIRKRDKQRVFYKFQNNFCKVPQKFIAGVICIKSETEFITKCNTYRVSPKIGLYFLKVEIFNSF